MARICVPYAGYICGYRSLKTDLFASLGCYITSLIEPTSLDSEKDCRLERLFTVVGHESDGESGSTAATNGLRQRSICFGLVFVFGLGEMSSYTGGITVRDSKRYVGDIERPA